MRVVIVRGPSGCGKSTFIGSRPELRDAHIVSTDHFWLRREEAGIIYDFDKTRIHEAHANCRRRFVKALYDGEHRLIVVDNNLHKIWMLLEYVEIAVLAAAEVHIVQFVPGTLAQIKTCALRGKAPAGDIYRWCGEFETWTRAEGPRYAQVSCETKMVEHNGEVIVNKVPAELTDGRSDTVRAVASLDEIIVPRKPLVT